MVGVLPPMIGFGLFFVGGVIGLIAIIWGIAAKVRKTSRGGAIAALLGAVPFIVVAASAGIMSGKSGPGINDITSDVADPPAFTKSTMHGSYPAEFGEKASKAYPNVKPLTLTKERAEVVKLASAIAGDFGWTIVESGDEGFEAFELTRMFRFRDDVVVRVRSGASGGSVVDMRSASRDGKADFGVNAARIEKFFAELEKRSK